MDIEEIRLQAQDENTAPEILAELANSEDRLTRQYVAGNPNTSIEILEMLSIEFPEAITANPIFYLLLLENSESKFLRLCLAKSSTTPVDTLEKLIETEDLEILCAVAKNFNSSNSILEKLAILKNNNTINSWNKSQVRYNLALNPKLSLFLMKILAKDKDNFVRYNLAVNTAIPVEIIELLAKDASSYVCQGVVSNPKTPVAIIEELAERNELDLRQELIKNPITPSSIIQKIFNKNRLTVELRILLGSTTKIIEIIEQLASDCKVIVRRAVASNPNTPASVLEQLLKDNYPDTHNVLLDNPSTPQKIKETIRFVRGENKVSIEFLEELTNSKYLYIRKLVAKNSLTYNRTLLKLSEDSNVVIRKTLLFRNNLASEIIDKILKTTIDIITSEHQTIKFSKESYILCLIARHNNTNNSTLEKLSSLLSNGLFCNTPIRVDRIKATMLNNY